MKDGELKKLLKLVPKWKLVSQDGMPAIRRTFKFPDFAEALAFGVKVGLLVEREDHHPAMLVEWGAVTLTFWTHRIKGLHRNDFVAAAKVDRLKR